MKRSESAALWPDQYWENYQGYPAGAFEVMAGLWEKYAQPWGVALELGCGRGDSTNVFLVPNFRRVIALDLLEKPRALAASVEYHQVDDDDYTCRAVGDGEVDFVYSFGVFCHLPISAQLAYLKSVRRVLRPRGIALIAFANWPRHSLLQSVAAPEAYREQVHSSSWYYCDVALAQDMSRAAGFRQFTDLAPTFRDTLAEII